MSIFFFKFSRKILSCHANIWSKTSTISKLSYIMRQKSQQDAFFQVTTKNKKCPFSRAHTALMPIFCQKNAHSSKNTVLTSHFFLMFHEKPPADVPIFNLKNVNSVKTILYYGPKKSVEYHYFPIFHEKITALMSILCQKNINFVKKNTLSQAHIL